MASTEPKMHYAASDWKDTLCGKMITGNLQATYDIRQVTCITCRRSKLHRGHR
jgi:hypothetical protein